MNYYNKRANIAMIIKYLFVKQQQHELTTIYTDTRTHHSPIRHFPSFAQPKASSLTSFHHATLYKRHLPTSSIF